MKDYSKKVFKATRALRTKPSLKIIKTDISRDIKLIDKPLYQRGGKREEKLTGTLNI